ncbi:MAG: hypothetical protein U0836_18050 [Pirellulales bacterium]
MSVALDESVAVVACGGRALRVGPLRVRHLAALERRLLAARVDPLPQLPAALAVLDVRQQEALLGHVYDALSRPARLAEGELAAYLETPEGLGEALWHSAHDADPALERDEFLTWWEDQPADSFDELRRRAFAALRIPWGNGAGQAQSATTDSPTLGRRRSAN